MPGSISAGSSGRRVHAEHHSSFVLSTLRTTFALDIPSDASPGFAVRLGAAAGGVAWKVRMGLLVGVAAEAGAEIGAEGVRVKGMVRAGERGRWGTVWKATEGIAPMERWREEVGAKGKGKGSWMAYLTSSLLGLEEEEEWEGSEQQEEEYDGIRGGLDGGVGVGVDFGGGETGWRDVAVETVECEVPIRVWAGNTAFKAVDVEFDV